MSTTVNSITAYVLTIDGTRTEFVREAVVSVNSADKTNFDTWETAAALVAGTQTVDFGGTVVAGNDAGLVTATYTASISIDGVAYPVSVNVTTADTFTTVIGLINADLPGTELGISGGNLVVTSSTTGNDSKVVITDVDLFSGMTGYVGVLAAVDGDLKTYLASQTLTNGANAASAYLPATEVYDTVDDEVVVATDAVAITDSTGGTANDTLEDVTITPTQTLINNNFADVAAKINALTTKVNSLQDIVEKLVLHK